MRLALVLLAACGARTAPATPGSGIDWSHPPRVTVERATLPPMYETNINGLRVVVVESHRLPLVSISIVATSAGGRAAWQTPGLATVCVDAIARSVDETNVETSVATEYAALETSTQTGDEIRVARALAQAIREPRFDPTIVDGALRRARNGQLMHRDASRSIAGRVLDRLLFAGHPYEVSAEGSDKTLQEMTQNVVRGFWQKAYAPGTVTLVIVGDADRDDVKAIAHAFADFAGQPPTTTPTPLAAFAPKLAVVDRPGTTTSIVLVGTRSDAGGAPTQLAADLANLMLGGGPDARLDKTLHDELKVTLGAGSSYWRGRLAGSWSVAASFPTDRTAEGLRATLAEIKRARDEVPTTADVARAKERLLRALATSFETNVGATRVLERMIGQGLTADWYSSYVRRLDAVTPADVQAAASKWNDLSIVIVGDWQKLKSELTSFGLPVTMYEP